MSDKPTSDTPRTDKWAAVCIQAHSMIVCARAFERELSALQTKYAAAIRRIAELEDDADTHPHELSPAMVQARNDQLNAELEEANAQRLAALSIAEDARKDIEAGNRQYAERVGMMNDLANDLRAQLAEANRKLEAATMALIRLRDHEDAPDIDATGQWEQGLFCGVEDRDLRDRYQGASFGHTVGVEKGLEWAHNEADTALREMGVSPLTSNSHKNSPGASSTPWPRIVFPSGASLPVAFGATRKPWPTNIPMASGSDMKLRDIHGNQARGSTQ